MPRRREIRQAQRGIPADREEDEYLGDREERDLAKNLGKDREEARRELEEYEDDWHDLLRGNLTD